MERTRDSLLLALFALPAPPDGMLINRRDRAAAKEQDEGGAASGAVEVDVVASCGRGGVEGAPSLDAARANRRMDPVSGKRRGIVGAARDDGGAPQRVPENCCLDATGNRKGRGAAGDRSGHDAEVEGGAHGRLPLYRQDLDDRDKKHDGGGAPGGSLASITVNRAPCSRGVCTTAGERFSMVKRHRFCDADEDGDAQGRFLQELDDSVKKQGAAGADDGSLATCAVNGAFSRGINKATCCRDKKAGMGFLNAGSASTTSKINHNGCLGSEEEVRCSSKTPAVWPDSHSSHSVGVHSWMGSTFRPDLGRAAAQCKLMPSISKLADAVNFRPDLGAAAQCQSMASISTLPDALNFRPGLGAAPQQKSRSSTCRDTDAMNSQANLGAAQRKSDFTLTLSSATKREERYDPVPELLLCSGEVLSKPWRRIWKHTPLFFHDKQLVRCLVTLGAASPGVVLNLTEQITNILEKHPGNVGYFRLDSSSWTGGQTKISEWLRRLSEKKAREIIIVNREDATTLEFPLEDLQSSYLESLRLAFVSLSDLDIHSFDYSNLDTLELVGCSFETIRLFHVIKDCRILRHLGIGLTQKDVRISSESLELLQIWKCNMQHLSIESAPRLQKLVNGTHPIWKHQHVVLMVHDTPVLQEFTNILLHVHKFEDQLWMRSLKKIALGIQMANQSHRKLMCGYFQHTAFLQELHIWRMDDIAPLEELDVPVDNSLLKLSGELPFFSSLLNFVMDGFRGGAAEISIATAILKYAVNLNEMKVCPCPTSHEEPIVMAFLALRNIKKASLNCSVRFVDSYS